MSAQERELLEAHGARLFGDRIKLQLLGDETVTVHHCTGSAIIAIYLHNREKDRTVVRKLRLEPHP